MLIAPDWRRNTQEWRRLLLLSLQHCLSDDAAADTDDVSAYVLWSLQSLLVILLLMLVTAAFTRDSTVDAEAIIGDGVAAANDYLYWEQLLQ